MDLFKSKIMQQHIGEDVFITWLSVLEEQGITDHDEVIEHLNTWNGFDFFGWEIARWKNQTRGVPRAAYEAMVAECFYWAVTGKIYQKKNFHTRKFELIKKLVIRRTKKGVKS